MLWVINQNLARLALVWSAGSQEWFYVNQLDPRKLCFNVLQADLAIEATQQKLACALFFFFFVSAWLSRTCLGFFCISTGLSLWYSKINVWKLNACNCKRLHWVITTCRKKCFHLIFIYNIELVYKWLESKQCSESLMSVKALSFSCVVLRPFKQNSSGTILMVHSVF